jgi:hypothetical protein
MPVGRQPLTLLLFAVAPLLGTHAEAQQDAKLQERVAKLDERLVKAFEELARKYDDSNDPEAAHLLASCAVGFGSKDPKIAGIKGAREVDLFVGKLRGGERLADANPIDTALRGIAFDLKKTLDASLPQLKRNELPPALARLVQDLVPKYELARGAEEYIQATQRFNQLRRAMGLRAILWDFEKSRELILACWYMGETDDYRSEVKSDTSSPLYTPAVELAKERCSRPLYRKLPEFPDLLRPYALIRQDLLNPDARQLWLAHWAGGAKVSPMTAYAIPHTPFRPDIPTASQRYTRDTVVESWPDWRDTEDTVVVAASKGAVARYPYDGESDAPLTFSNGKGAMEYGWQDSEIDFLAKAGTPIMLRVFLNAGISLVQAELADPSGRSLATRVYMTGDSRVRFYGDWPTVLIVPSEQLAPGKEYRVRVTGQLDTTPFERTWLFKTRAR